MERRSWSRQGWRWRFQTGRASGSSLHDHSIRSGQVCPLISRSGNSPSSLRPVGEQWFSETGNLDVERDFMGAGQVCSALFQLAANPEANGFREYLQRAGNSTSDTSRNVRKCFGQTDNAQARSRPDRAGEPEKSSWGISVGSSNWGRFRRRQTFLPSYSAFGPMHRCAGMLPAYARLAMTANTGGAEEANTRRRVLPELERPLLQMMALSDWKRFVPETLALIAVIVLLRALVHENPAGLGDMPNPTINVLSF